MNLSREQICEDPRVTSFELIYPTIISEKKKWSITSKCDKCGETTSKWFQRNTWTFLCGKCSRGRRTTKEFIIAAIEQHGEKYSYSNTRYTNNDTKVNVTCKSHGDWSVRPTDFLAGSNCPTCAREEGNKKKEYSITQWKTLLVNPLVSVISKDNRDFGTFKCKAHGKFTARFSNIVKSPSSGCVVCLRLQHQPQSKRENLIGTSVSIYWVYIPSVDMYKLGCTTQSIDKRFSKEGKVTMLWSKIMDYSKGIDFEHKVHTRFTSLRYSGKIRLIEEGTNELYHTNEFPTFEHLQERLC
jgi:ssDNA-binding Zn-finger/Zn-ribbon topoisomerase 1